MFLLGSVYSKSAFGKLAEAYTRAAWNQGVWARPTWLGVPVLQMPEDLLAMAALVHRDAPDVVIETGVMHGGSVLFYASLLRVQGTGKVIGIDVSLKHCGGLEGHPLADTFELLEGDSTSPGMLEQVRQRIPPGAKVLVVLDSDHSRAHVAAELEAYAPLVGVGGHLVVFDGVMQVLHDAPHGDPAWRRDNPLAATHEFLARHPEFEIDTSVPSLGITFAPDGVLRRRA